MTSPSIMIAGEGDRRTIIDVITLGFSADPMMRWIWPDARTYLETMPGFVTAFAGGAFEHGTAYCTETLRAAALWLPPGTEPDIETMSALIEATAPPEIAEGMPAVAEQMGTYHPHDRPYWYLPLIGADPACQGRGLGSALMKHALRRCDEEELPAYLESSNPRNLSLYERHGFEVMGRIQAGSSPVVHPMIREPRR